MSQAARSWRFDHRQNGTATEVLGTACLCKVRLCAIVWDLRYAVVLQYYSAERAFVTAPVAFGSAAEKRDSRLPWALGGLGGRPGQREHLATERSLAGAKGGGSRLPRRVGAEARARGGVRRVQRGGRGGRRGPRRPGAAWGKPRPRLPRPRRLCFRMPPRRAVRKVVDGPKGCGSIAPRGRRPGRGRAAGGGEALRVRGRCVGAGRS